MYDPKIGIIANTVITKEGLQFAISTPVVVAVHQAGGIPFHLPNLPGFENEYLEMDGYLFPGGAPISGNDFLRDHFELELIRRVVGYVPVLGIGRGCQALNVALGGNLIQDIASNQASLRHVEAEHAVIIIKESRINRIFGVEHLSVPSDHHQSIDRVGEGLAATAFSCDHHIEAIESPRGPFTIGVQWQAESQKDCPRAALLFKAFVDACR